MASQKLTEKYCKDYKRVLCYEICHTYSTNYTLFQAAEFSITWKIMVHVPYEFLKNNLNSNVNINHTFANPIFAIIKICTFLHCVFYLIYF